MKNMNYDDSVSYATGYSISATAGGNGRASSQRIL